MSPSLQRFTFLVYLRVIENALSIRFVDRSARRSDSRSSRRWSVSASPRVLEAPRGRCVQALQVHDGSKELGLCLLVALHLPAGTQTHPHRRGKAIPGSEKTRGAAEARDEFDA